MLKRCKVVMLPTNEKVINTKEYQLLLSNSLFWTSKIEIERYTEGWFFLKNSSSYNSCAITIPNVENFKHQHLYIISDDEIKEGDWFYNIHSKIVGRAAFNFGKDELAKKIIATTDDSLGLSFKVNHGASTTTTFTPLPQPSKQFIKKYVESYNKGEIITNVLVEYETLYDIELLVDTQDFRKGSYIRGRCSSKEDFSKAKKRFFELHTDGNHYSIARDTNKVNILYKTYFRDVEFTDVKINPKDNTITIKKVKDSWNRKEVVQLLIDCCAEISSIHGKLKGKEPADLYKWIEENL